MKSANVLLAKISHMVNSTTTIKEALSVHHRESMKR
jgi:hypothetical protein